jgi:hypothetical protein
MAINNTEDPEEGTPRSKKDIRRDRREMKSINRQRRAMGGQDLYVEKDFEEIKKPIKSKPGEVLSGTIGGVTYNDPNKPAEYSEFEYKQYEPGGYTKSVKPMTEEEFNANTKSEPISIWFPSSSPEGKYIVSKDYNDYLRLMNEKYNPPSKETTIPVTQEQFQTIIGNPNEDPNNEKIRQERETLKNTLLTPSNATTVTDVIQTKIDNDNTLTLNDKENLTKTNTVTRNEIQRTEDEITNEELQNKSQLQTLGEGPMQYNWTDAYVKEGFTPESPEAILSRAANAARKKAPSLVVEKLGIQDYYPEIGRDIAVGTFTGSRIGSQTIYSGAGGLLPLGLYDARKRAIAADIKKKEALMDQLKEIPDIAKQYKPSFTEDFFNKISPYVDAYKDNPEGLASDRGFLELISNQKAVAENFTKVDAYLKDLEDKIVDPKTGKPAVWVPTGVLKIINNIKSGMVPGKIEDYYSGKKNIAKVLDTVRALPNALNQGDKIVQTLIKDGAIERAINLKTGKDFNPKELEDMNNLIKQLKSPSPDYEVFSELKRKYYDFGYEQIAEDWVNMNMQDQPESIKKEVKESMSRYMFSQMPKESIISTITKQANDYTTRRGQDLQIQNAREQRAFEAEQNRLAREDSITKLEIENMIENGETYRSVSTPDSPLGTYPTSQLGYTVYDKSAGKYRPLTGNQIREEQSRGKVFYDRSGNVFKLPTSDPTYEQGKIDYHNKNGTVQAISTGTAYTTKIVDGEAVMTPLNVTTFIPAQVMTTPDGRIDTGRAGEFDIKRGRNVSGAAEGTGGTRSYSTGSSRYKRQ